MYMYVLELITYTIYIYTTNNIQFKLIGGETQKLSNFVTISPLARSINITHQGRRKGAGREARAAPIFLSSKRKLARAPPLASFP